MANGLVHTGVVRFMQKDNVIKRNDFEQYEILIPFSSSLGKKRKQFICSQLEKMHPCFSDEFAFDSVIKKITQKGFYEDVFVVNKFRLAEYEQKRKFSGTGFFIEKSVKSKLPALRLFADKKWQFFVIILAFCILGVIAGIIFGFSGSNKNAIENVQMTEPVVEIEINNNLPDFSAGEQLLSYVAEAGGKISRFDWSVIRCKNELFEQLNASIKGAFPENLNGFSTSNVIYENGIPCIDASYANKTPEHNILINEKQTSSLPNSDFNKELRAIITRHAALLREEKAPPYHIEFDCEMNLEKNQKMLMELFSFIEADNRIVTAVSVIRTSGNELHVGLSIEPASFNGQNLQNVIENLALFTSSDSKVFSVADKNNMQNKVIYETGKNKTSEDKGYETKIGEIRRPDKTTLIFYKNAEGKIKTVIQSF